VFEGSEVLRAIRNPRFSRECQSENRKPGL